MNPLTQQKDLHQLEGQMLSKTEQLMQNIRRTPIFRQLIPQEAGVGWAIPLRRQGKVYATLPFFGYSPTAEKGKTALFPPFATITLNWSNHVPVEYVNLRFQNPAPQLKWEEQVGTFPHPAVLQMSVGQYKEKRNQLLFMYDELFNHLVQDSTFTPEWNAEFSQLLRTLIEPSLEPYYRVLGSKFFNRFLPVNK